MKKLLVVMLVMSGATTANAQEYPRYEGYVGYSYINIGTNKAGGQIGARQNANGWQVADSLTVIKWLALEGSTSGYYRSYQIPINLVYPYPISAHNSSHVSDLSIAAGPRINLRRLFFHALLGADILRNTLTPPGTGASPIIENHSGFMGIFGGGIEIPISTHLAFRTGTDYVLTHHNVGSGFAYQNSFRVGGGLVLKLGKVSSRRAAADSQTAQGAPRGMLIPALGIVVKKPLAGEGAEIAEIIPDSVVAQTALHVRDVINSVDNKPIRTPMELAVALTEQPRTKVKLGVLIRGLWQSETAVILGKAN
jgi:hypothetical protein